MKVFDKSLELVACGSSHANMPTYPEWEAEVLSECFDNVDYISLHTYWDNWDNDTQNFLAKTVLLYRYINTVGGIIDYVASLTDDRAGAAARTLSGLTGQLFEAGSGL